MTKEFFVFIGKVFLLFRYPEQQHSWKVCLIGALYCTTVNFLQPEAYYFAQNNNFFVIKKTSPAEVKKVT